MLHQIVTAGGGNDLNVLHVVEHGNLTQRRPIAPQLVGMDHLRHVVFPQEADKKGLGRLGVSVFLKQNVQHVPVFVDRSPQPMLGVTLELEPFFPLRSSPLRFLASHTVVPRRERWRPAGVYLRLTSEKIGRDCQNRIGSEFS